MEPKRILYWILELYQLTSTQKGLNYNNEEQQFLQLMVVFVCLFIILSQ